MEIDHVVPAARTRADAEQAVSRAGLGIARGRTVPGLGLSNLVVPLRHGQVLEIHWPNGEAPAPGAPPLLEFDREALAAHPSATLVPMAWLVAVEDEQRLRDLAATNGMSVVDVPAEGPDHPPCTLAGFGQNFDRRYLPCLIHWPRGHAVLGAAHRRRPVGITGIEVAGPADVIEGWCGGRPSGLHTVPGTAGPLRVEVGFEDGEPLVVGLAE